MEEAQRLVLAAHPPAVQEARRVLREALREAGVERAREREAVLVMSELITNAIQHGSGADDEIEVRWSLSGGKLRLWVSDAARGRGTPVALTPDEERARGRGLRIVDQLAHSWGEQIVGGRREVMIELHVQ